MVWSAHSVSSLTIQEANQAMSLVLNVRTTPLLQMDLPQKMIVKVLFLLIYFMPISIAI